MRDVTAVNAPDEQERRRRVRRSFIVLVLVAVAFYVAFIVMTVMRGGHG
ncbi:MAG: hypothetical protein IRZ28_14740 [Steroidobacteraceae bacterium]|nr:hypothetical protein [Steroidobacteraceae bacterium]